jgi:hypothetical protein
MHYSENAKHQMRQLADAPVIQSQCNLDGLVDQANFDNIDIPLQIR